MGFEKALGAVKVIKDQIQNRSQSLLNLARGYFSYPQYQEHMLDFRNIFPWLLFKTIHLSGPKLLNIVSGQNYGRSKTDLASMLTPP